MQTGSLGGGAGVDVGGVRMGVAVGGTGVGEWVAAGGEGVGVAVGETRVGVGVGVRGTGVGVAVAACGTGVGVEVPVGVTRAGVGVGSPGAQAAMKRSVAAAATALRIVLLNAPSFPTTTPSLIASKRLSGLETADGEPLLFVVDIRLVIDEEGGGVAVPFVVVDVDAVRAPVECVL